MTNKYQHSSKDIKNLIIKIQAMETYMWSSMLKDINNGKDCVDYYDLLERYNHIKDIYERSKLCHDIMDILKKDS